MYLTRLILKHSAIRFVSSFFSLSILTFLILPVSAQHIQNERRVVDRFGQLHIDGSYVIDEHNDTVTLEGMSFFWSQWMGKYYNYDCVKWLRDDWHCDVVRAAMGIEYGGYLQHPDKEKEKIDSVVEAAIDLGIYVIIDWHSHNAQKEAGAAVQFFSAMAKTYGNHPNVIYEIFNEPMIISWDTVIKPYSENLIHAIRRYDPDNIIIVGTPSWSQDVDIAARNPIDDTNIAYALHFYAGTHRQWLRDKADTALKKGLALWVTEFGTCKADGKGDIYPDELNEWFDYMDQHKISWCNWSVADKKETASILKPRADKNGYWPESKLTKSGILIRNKLRGKNL